jgi:predicted transcriptional regulator of viral defense system
MARQRNAVEEERILDLFRDRGGWLRQADLLAAGHHPRWLRRLTLEGAIHRVRKGQYRLATAIKNPDDAILDVGRAIPAGIICLLSALKFHDLLSITPEFVDVAIDRKAHPPVLTNPPTRVFWFSPRQLDTGVVVVDQGGTSQFRIFDPEKTICDCIRHRGTVGQEMVTAGLRAYLAKKPDLGRLLRMAEHCRVGQRLRTYLEVLL